MKCGKCRRVGHIPATYAATKGVSEVFLNGTSSHSLSDVPKSPIPLPGNATVAEIFTQARLEVSAGLGISIILMLVALPSLLFHEDSTDDKDRSVNGTGILHAIAIWLYRNHPELETLLEQVEHPTDDNLRAAGLAQTRLVGRRVQKERRKSF
ncbi:hypothetical protein B0H13DRAFT_1879674 [Mycena leptocephala]|nr:hypothetical protein B0H13DRAFT_1879674 [Mycena leptocephala]